MNTKKGRQTLDNIVYQRNRGYRVSNKDLDVLIEDSSESTNENAYLYYMKSCSALESHRYRDAVEYNRKALSLCEDDTGVYLSVQAQFGSLASAMARMGRFEPNNLEVGWLYESLRDYACLGFDNHVLALRHYQTIGETKKEKRLARILTELYPHHPIVEEYNQGNKKTLKREGRDEKNQNQQKVTTICRIKTS